MIDILTGVVEPIAVSLISVIGVIWVAYIKNTQKNYNSLKADNEAVQAKLDLILNHFDVHRENEVIIADLHRIKSYYVLQFENKKNRSMTSWVVDKFIAEIEKVIGTYPVDIGHFMVIKNEFDTVLVQIESCVQKYLGEELSVRFTEKNNIRYEIFLNELERIVTDTSNGHKGRLVATCNEYMKDIIKCLKEIGG